MSRPSSDTLSFKATSVAFDQEGIRLLRRGDWRFLLPDPAPRVSTVFGRDPLLETAVRELSTRVVAPSSATPGSCCLAVVVNPTAAVLEHAFSLLRPGGCCYVEWHRRFAGPSSVRRLLWNAGLRGVRTYSPWPNVHECRVWLPRDNEVISREYVRSRRVGRRRSWRGLADRLLADTATVRRRLTSGLTISAVGRKTASSDAARFEWDGPGGFLSESGFQFDVPRPAYAVLNTSGWRNRDKVVALLYAVDRTRPFAVLKFPRSTDGATALAHEVEILRHLDRYPGIPRVLRARWHHSIFGVIQTAVHGTRIRSVANGATYVELARSTTKWLSGLASATKSTPARAPESVARVVRDFEAGFGSVVDPALMNGIRDRLAALNRIPSVCEHRDFVPDNVLVGENLALSVFDWEWAVLQGFPATDLICFLSYLAAGAGDDLFASYRSAWSPASRIGQVNLACVAEYLEKLGVNRSLIPTLRLLTWVLQANCERVRCVADGPDAVAGLRTTDFLSLLKYDLSHSP